MRDDILFDPESRDLALTPTGQLRRTSGLQRVAQRLRHRLLRYRGEWFIDQRLGVPHRELVLTVKPPRLAQYGAALKATILGTRGVDTLEAFDVRMSGVDVVCTFTVTVDGRYVTGKFSPTSADIGTVFADAQGVTL